jgi:hypothetical protein
MQEEAVLAALRKFVPQVALQLQESAGDATR